MRVFFSRNSRHCDDPRKEIAVLCSAQRECMTLMDTGLFLTRVRSCMFRFTQSQQVIHECLCCSSEYEQASFWRPHCPTALLIWLAPSAPPVLNACNGLDCLDPMFLAIKSEVTSSGAVGDDLGIVRLRDIGNLGDLDGLNFRCELLETVWLLKSQTILCQPKQIPPSHFPEKQPQG